MSFVTDSKETDSTQGADLYQREEGKKSGGSSGPTGSEQRPTAADKPVSFYTSSVCYLGIHLGFFFFFFFAVSAVFYTLTSENKCAILTFRTLRQ